MPENPKEQAEIDRAAVAWTVRLGSPALDDAGQRTFRAWLDADPAHAAAFEAARGVWDGLEAPAAALAAAEGRRVRRRAATAVVLAACLLAALALPLLRGGADFEAGAGRPETVALADGSRMTLDGRAAVEVAFGTEARRVTLRRGRAFFEVMPDPARPFVVAAGGVETTAIGTGFAVERQGGLVSVVVEHGLVAVRGATGGAVELAGGERVAAADGRVGEPEAAALGPALAWRRGLMVFEDRTLGEVAAELNRATGVRVFIAQASVRELELSGVFREADPEAVLDAIESGLGVRLVDLGPATVIFR